MTTTLPVGTYFRFRRKGEWDYGRVVEGQRTYQLLAASQVPIGSKVHDCIWRGAALISRRMQLHSAKKKEDE